MQKERKKCHILNYINVEDKINRRLDLTLYNDLRNSAIPYNKQTLI